MNRRSFNFVARKGAGPAHLAARLCELHVGACGVPGGDLPGHVCQAHRAAGDVWQVYAQDLDAGQPHARAAVQTLARAAAARA